MENTEFDGGTGGDPSEEELLDEDSISVEEEAFMRGYSDEEEVKTCEECGVAIKGKSVVKDVDGDTCHFCSEDCVKEYEESIR